MNSHQLLAILGLLSAVPTARLSAQAQWLDSARTRLAQLDGEIRVEGLDSAVEVRRDRWGVPHIYAKTVRDLFFAQGFVAAQDRLWQIDMWRRIGEGRVAEVLGPEYVERDRFARLLKYRGDMEAEWASYAPDTRLIVTSFVAGLNAYVRLVRERPPVEYSLLGFRPEPFADDVPLQRLAALSMTGNATTELERALLVQVLGKQRTEELFPLEPEKPLDLPPGLDLTGIAPSVLRIVYEAYRNLNYSRLDGSNNWVVSGGLTATGKPLLVQVLGKQRTEELFPLEPEKPLDPPPGLDLTGIAPSVLRIVYEAYRNLNYSRLDGSNNWVVSGGLTASGKPLLANDPHRSITTPSLRYLTHLVGPGWNVIGAGEPALPGVAGGHNERIGFGFTIVGMDQQDVYLEQLGRCPHASPRRCYLTQSGWRPVTTLVDTIPVKGQAPRIVELEFTEHGPIVAEDSSGRGFVIKFVGAEPGTAGYLAQISINRATDWESFKAAAARWKLPTENLVYADVDGNIGWIAAGLMPVRPWTGMLPVPGDGRFEWQGFLPFEELPISFNPPSGIIATANHNILPPDYTRPLSYEWAEPSRFKRIMEVLQSRKGWTRQDFEKLQHDELSIPARELVPLLLAAGERTGAGGPGWDHMKRWDFLMRKDGVAPLLFAAFVDSLSARSFATAVGPHAPALRQAGVGGLDLPVLMRFVKEPGRDSLLVGAFEAAVARLEARLGGELSQWRWGTVHTAPFRHPLAQAFDLPDATRAGHWSTVGMTAGPNLRQTHGASFREILDFSDWDNSVGTSVPGQSGQPGSPFYGNLLPLWERGEYFPLVYSRAAVEKHTAHVLVLRP